MENQTPLPTSAKSAAPHPERRASTAWLNGLRGMASLIVALNHYLYGDFSSPWKGFGSWPSESNRYFHQLPFIRTIWCGHAMPPLFFVISGYCACYTAIHLRETHGPSAMLVPLSRSAFRRGLRLYLPVFFMATLSQVVLFCGLYNYSWTNHTLQPWHAPLAHLKYLLNYLLDITNPIQTTTNPGLNIQYWVIPHEYLGSLLSYLTALALATVNRTLRAPILLLVILAPAIYRGDCHIYPFLAGVLIAELNLLEESPTTTTTTSTSPSSSPNPTSRLLHRRLNALLFLAAWYLLCLPDNYDSTPGYAFLAALEPARQRNWATPADAQRNWRALAACLLVYAMSGDERLRRLPNARLPQRLAALSWEVYLCHLLLYRMWRAPLVGFAAGWFAGAGAGAGEPGAYDLAVGASGAVMAGLVQWAAVGLKRVNAWLGGWARRAEAWALEG